ncbi:MAG: gfo/Idh/MocA family oxidoreductase, partial [Bacteroidales bacterium]|nr:gfo/Idh/MocA family oxidoreductase [Bacteroidales bacterium]
IYPIFLALHLWGEPKSVKAKAQFSKDNVDIHNNIEFKYDNHTAILESSFKEDLKCEATFFGEKGQLKMHRMWHIPCPVSITIDNKEEDITPNYISNGYNYEIAHVQDCLEKNLTESKIMTFDFSLLLMKYLDKIALLHKE